MVPIKHTQSGMNEIQTSIFSGGDCLAIAVSDVAGVSRNEGGILMSKSAQEMFDELVAERNKLKKEINKWIYTAQKMERERDEYKSLVQWVECFTTSLAESVKRILKKT